MEQLFLNFSDTQKTIIIIVFIIGIIAIGVGLDMCSNHDAGIIPLFAIIGGIIVITLDILFYFNIKKLNQYRMELDEIHTTAEEMIRDGAKVYLDGQLIDAEKIILRDYKVTIKDDFIIISNK